MRMRYINLHFTNPSEWNRLPLHIHTKPSVNCFKVALKSFLSPLTAPNWYVSRHCMISVWQVISHCIDALPCNDLSCYGALEIVCILLLLINSFCNSFPQQSWLLGTSSVNSTFVSYCCHHNDHCFDAHTAVDQFSCCLQDLEWWMSASWLRLNASKM